MTQKPDIRVRRQVKIMADVKKYEKLLTDLNSSLWDLAEIRFEEKKSSAMMEKILKEHGFEVTRGAGELPTAYEAVYGTGSPVIGLLAEYDALDGSARKRTVPFMSPARRQLTGMGWRTSPSRDRSDRSGTGTKRLSGR